METTQYSYSPLIFTLCGTLFGLLFPLAAILLITLKYSCSFYDAQMTYGGSLIWIIELAPIVLGATFHFLGRKHQALKNLNETLEEEVINKTHEAIKNKILYEKHKTIVDLSVTCNHEINNPLTIAVAMVDDLEQEYGQSPEIKNLMSALQHIHETVKAIDSIRKEAPEEISYSSYSSGHQLIKLNKKAS